MRDRGSEAELSSQFADLSVKTLTPRRPHNGEVGMSYAVQNTVGTAEREVSGSGLAGCLNVCCCFGARTFASHSPCEASKVQARCAVVRAPRLS